MSSITGFIGSLIGGLVGALIWAGIGYFLNAEIGYVALLVGFLAGLGAQLGAKNQEGVGLGFTAAVVALLAVAGGKYMTVHFYMQSFMTGGAGDEEVITYVADEIAYESILNGDRLRWPAGVDPDSAWGEEEYPDEVWREATMRWNRMSAIEQDQLREAPYLANPDYLVSLVADDVITEWEEADREIDWPDGSEDSALAHEADYPTDVWREADDRWTSWSTSDQEDYRDWVIAERQHLMQSLQQYATNAGFMASLGLFDLLWAGLAVVVAFRVASGGVKD